MSTLSLCMIAKDEQEYIEELLKIAKPFVDEIIVALDHRSTDRTQDILEKYGAQIIDFNWVDDFSKARNASLKPASSDWILVLDADERITPDDFKRIRALIKDTDADAFFLHQRNYTSNSKLFGWKPNDPKNEMAKGSGYTDNPLIRLFRNDPNIRFRNPVHEVVDESIQELQGTIAKLDIPMHHYGNLKKEEDLQKKREMYLAISEKQIGEDPVNPRPYYEAAKVLKSLDKLEDAKSYLEKAAALNPGYQLVLTNLADVYNKLGHKDLAVHTYLRAIKTRPKNENAYINLSLLLMKDKKTKEAIALLDRALSLNPKSAAAYNNLSLLLIQEKKYLQAMLVLQKAIDHTSLRKFKDALGRIKPRVEALFAKKEKELSAKIKDDPANLELVTQLGQLYFKQHSYEKAASLFSNCLLELAEEAYADEKNSPLVFNIYSNLSLAYERLGNTSDALKVLNKALSYNPPHKEFFENKIAKLSAKN